MKFQALLGLAPVALCAAITLTAVLPAQARSNRLDAGAPHWLDQTVYLPNCLLAVCACDCRSERVCLPACVQW